MDKLLSVLPDEGAITFADFVTACRAINAPAGLWLRVKHEGKLFTWLENGVLYISKQPKPESAVNNGG